MRGLRPALALLATPVLLAITMRADTKPTFTGDWSMDVAKSQAADSRTVTLTIDNSSSTVKMVRVVHEKDGKEVTYQFNCEVGGECQFDDAGHKAKVTLWYSGDSLVALTTDGPKEDASDEYTFKLSPDQKTLTLELEHIDPSGKVETLVFNKK